MRTNFKPYLQNHGFLRRTGARQRELFGPALACRDLSLNTRRVCDGGLRSTQTTFLNERSREKRLSVSNTEKKLTTARDRWSKKVRLSFSITRMYTTSKAICTKVACRWYRCPCSMQSNFTRQQTRRTCLTGCSTEATRAYIGTARLNASASPRQ